MEQCRAPDMSKVNLAKGKIASSTVAFQRENQARLQVPTSLSHRGDLYVFKAISRVPFHFAGGYS